MSSSLLPRVSQAQKLVSEAARNRKVMLVPENGGGGRIQVCPLAFIEKTQNVNASMARELHLTYCVT